MKIKTLNLKLYGKFENKKIEFNDGLNIIYGENGSGKTTVSTALKAFLYKDIKGDGKYKKIYIPLGEKQGGYDVRFQTDNNEEYETYVTVGQTAAKTIHKTMKLSENREVSSGKDVGEYFFETLEDMYDSVCFIKEPADFEKVSKNDKAVNEKLSQNTAKERSSVDITEAIDELNKERLTYARQTQSGYIYPKEKELEDINKLLFEIEGISYEDNRLKKKEEELLTGLSSLKNEKEKCEELLNKHKRYEKYSDYLKTEKSRKRIAELNEKLNELDLEKYEISASEIEQIKSADNFKEEKSPLAMIFLGMAAMFLGLSFLWPFCAAVALVLLAATGVISFVHLKKTKSRKEELLNNKYEILSKVKCKTLEEYYNKNNNYNKNIERKEDYEKEIENLLSILPKEASYEVQSEEKPEGDAYEINNRLLIINEEISSLSLEIASVSERRKSLYNNLPPYEELKERKTELEDEIEALKLEEQITLAALNMLELTRETYKVSYLPYISKRAEEILFETEKEFVDKLVVDQSFSPSLRENGGLQLKSKEHLSSGISDSAFFAIRLAILETVFENREKPVLILDDPFVRMDDERAAQWIKYLMKNTDWQIIYFTAGKRIFNLGLENNTILAL